MTGRHDHPLTKALNRRKAFSLALGALLTLQALAAPVLTAPAIAENKAPVKTARIQPEPAYTMQTLDEDDAGDAMTQSKPLQGSITSVRVVKGRSQIVKFAQPIMRISITEPSIADVVPLSPDQIMINGKLRGVTSLIVWDENGQEGIFDLYVQNDTSELMDAVQAIAPNEKIQARVTDDTFVLTGQVSNSVILDEIRKLASAYGYRDSDDPKEDKFVDLTETPVPQVVLEVKIAEANRSTGRILKTGFETVRGHMNTTRLANPLDATFLSKVANRATSTLNPSQFGSIFNNQAASTAGGLTGNFVVVPNHFSVMWDSLETSGKINLLANPTLVCTHGREASFLAGGEFPFVGGTDQNGSPIISFKEFGVKLHFTPWIAIRSGRIELKVEPEVSSRDSSSCVAGSGGNPVCGLLTRKTSTTVELQDGESLMISGILSREEQNSFNKVPFIGEVPILGALFKNGDMSKSDRELMVIITPRIVKPSHYGSLLGSS